MKLIRPAVMRPMAKPVIRLLPVTVETVPSRKPMAGLAMILRLADRVMTPLLKKPATQEPMQEPTQVRALATKPLVMPERMKKPIRTPLSMRQSLPIKIVPKRALMLVPIPTRDRKPAVTGRMVPTKPVALRRKLKPDQPPAGIRRRRVMHKPVHRMKHPITHPRTSRMIRHRVMVRVKPVHLVKKLQMARMAPILRRQPRKVRLIQ